ncbi:hypothetical protein [Roseibium sp. RKSG952]|uniref:hypothetical protein n=1 Tax=Roseibium sp. RKSG952 TaxID=2529384 RepID=UPI0012BBF17D|nr:hypothetical protein [Roseibium sp. RKSG952]MTH95032.1 hypothetical protein [Roseibium sp. RKSG952]
MKGLIMTVEHEKFCRISYWKGSTASSKCGEWDRCEISPRSTHSGYGTHTFTPDQEYEMDALIALLWHAFKAGEEHELKRIHTALRI